MKSRRVVAAIGVWLITGGALAAQSALEVELVEPGVISTGAFELTPTFSSDGKLALWSISTPAYARWIGIVQSTKQGATWGKPVIAPFSGKWIDADPFFTEDGKRLFFLSRRPLSGTASERGYRIWYVDRKTGGWGAPIALGPHINNADMHYVVPVRSGDLYISAVREDSRGQGDLYRVPWKNGTWAAPENLGPVINSADRHDTTPYVAPDESYIIFASQRLGGVGGLDLYISLRNGNDWSVPILLPEPINGLYREFCPVVSPDGKWLYFTSERGFADTPLAAALSHSAAQRMLSTPGNGLGDVYRTSLPDLLKWAREH